MIVQEFKLGNTTIQVDDTYYPKTEEEKNRIYEEFNRIGCEIIYNRGGWIEMRKIIAIISFLMILGQVGELDLGAELNGQVIFKLLTLLIVFILAVRKYIK